MALGTTNISTDVVKAVIGSSSDDVGKLCNGSSSDVNTPAFYVAEYTGNGGKIDGEIRPGMRPKWNIWSSQSPGEFVVDGNGFLIFRLKRNPYNTTPAYIYGLDYFRNYNHTAEKPLLITTTTPIRVINNAIETTFRFYFGTLYNIMKLTLNKTHMKFDILIDNTWSFNSGILPLPTLPPEGDPIYIDYTRAYPGYTGITNMSGVMRVKITFYSDKYGSSPLELNQLLMEEIYGHYYDYKDFAYVDNYDGAWIKQAFTNSYSDTNCNITGAVDGTGYTVVNGRVLIPTGGYTDGAFVNVTITRKSTSYTNVSFDITFDGLYTQRYTVAIQNGTSLLEPNTNSGISIDGQEHYYTINNITFS